ncbi:MAG: glycosyltransferase family 61 protein [Pikeienuella sp.]
MAQPWALALQQLDQPDLPDHPLQSVGDWGLTASTPPRPNGGWSGEIAEIANARLIPPWRTEDPQQTGAIDDTGTLIPHGVTWRGTWPSQKTPIDPPPIKDQRPGTWLYAGQLFWHFGHFLTESAARLWAIEQLRERIDGILFLPKRVTGGDYLLDWQKEFFTAAGVDKPIEIITEPTQVEKLLIPGQGFGLGEISSGTSAFQKFTCNRFAQGIAPDGPEKLYITRSAFGPNRGGVIGEDIIETYMADEGYEILHPQKASLANQIARYKAAKYIVALDGSALHLAGYVARPDQNIAMIMRRNATTPATIILQLQGFRGKPPLVINTIEQDWVPAGSTTADRQSFCQLDFQQLHRELLEAQFITDETPWVGPTSRFIRRRIARLSRRKGVELVPLKPSPRVLIQK